MKGYLYILLMAFLTTFAELFFMVWYSKVAKLEVRYMLNVIEDARNEFKIELTDKWYNILKLQFGTSNIKKYQNI